MNNLSDIKRRITSVRQTRQITGAMEMISVAKMRKAVERLNSYNTYFDVLYGVVSDIILRGGSETEDIVKSPKSGSDLVIVIASDKGLCGGFNHEILKFADSIIGNDTVVMPIGQMACEHFSNNPNTDMSLSCSDVSDLQEVKNVADAVLDGYGKTYKSISIVYTRLLTQASWSPRSIKILPLDKDNEFLKTSARDKSHSVVDFQPSAAAVLERLMPMYVNGMIYGAIAHSRAAEHSARRASMSASTRNADEMIDRLSIEYNRARQSAVTEQVTGIIGSTEAIGMGGAE